MKKACESGLVLVVLFAGLVQASPVTITSIEGGWSNPAGWPNGLASLNYYSDVSVSYGNGLQDQIRWGSGTSSQSGLGFTGNNGSVVNVGEVFEIGQLAHFNNPIGAYTSLTSVDLDISILIAGVGTNVFTFELGIDETPNDPGPPASNDIISFPSAYAEQTFDMGGETYTLKLLGFGTNSNSLLDIFSSPEGGTQTTLLWGMITQPQTVPAPGALLCAALGFVWVSRQRIRRSA